MTTITDPKVNAKAELIRTTTDAKVTAADAATERAIRLKEAQLALELREREAETARKNAAAEKQRQDKAAKQRDKKARKASRKAARRAFVASTVAYVRVNMVAVYCAVIYAMSVAVAVIGQISMAGTRGWPILVGVGIAVFVEGIALSMALTGHEMRLAGERAFVPRFLTWLAAGFAAGINYLAHAADDPVLAVVFAASSLAGITVWEVRSAAKHRAELRRRKLIPEPPTRFGIRRWLRYPVSTFQAWSVDIKYRVTGQAATILGAITRNRAAERAAKRCHKLDMAAAKTGSPIITATVIITEDGAYDNPWALPPAVESAGLRRTTRSDQTRSVRPESDRTIIDVTPDPVGFGFTEAAPQSDAPVRPEPKRSADQTKKVRPAHTAKSDRPTTDQSGKSGAHGTAMAEAFHAAVAAGRLPSHFDIRDTAAEALDDSTIDISYAKRLHARLEAKLAADVRERLEVA